MQTLHYPPDTDSLTSLNGEEKKKRLDEIFIYAGS
jgi:hypothetical protein